MCMATGVTVFLWGHLVPQRNTKAPDQFVDRIAIHSVTAFTARGAAGAALQRFQRLFDEPLFYWDRNAGEEMIDEIDRALSIPPGNPIPAELSDAHRSLS